MIDFNYDFCNRHRHDAQPCKSPPSKTLPRCGLCGLCGPQKLPLWLEGAHMRNVFEEGVWASPQGRAPPDESNRLEQLQEGGPRVQLKVWSLCIIFALSFVSYRIFRVLIHYLRGLRPMPPTLVHGEKVSPGGGVRCVTL